ncbi:MAG: ribokinase [Rhizobacter sp.]|nr:ribokinase [Rhizobacter sp.]
MSATPDDTAALIVVVGSLNIDLVVRAPRLPLPGETLSGDGFAQHEGGKGGNQAVAAARCGARVAMLGRVGDDAHGERLLRALRGDGIDCSAVGHDTRLPTGVAAITVAHSGENSIVVVPGANRGLLPSHIDASAALIAGAKLLVAQLESPLVTVAHALALARRAGVATLLNAAPATSLPAEVLQSLDWLVVNQIEAQLLSGMTVHDQPSASAAAQALHAMGPRQVVVTLGAGGLVHADLGGTRHFPALPAQAIDSTGAGDTFVGGLAACLALGMGMGIDDALRWGQAAAAIAVERHGAQPSMPTRAEVQARAQGM